MLVEVLSVLGMTLNYKLWGSSSGALGSVEYPFIVITPRPTLTKSCSTCCLNEFIKKVFKRNKIKKKAT